MKTIAQQLGITKFPFQIKDDRGNVIYWENSDEFWVKWELDLQGRELYYEDSDGFWEKIKRDSEGREIYFENSKNYWVKRQYDENGKEIYFENSEGIIEDNRPKQAPKSMDLEITKKFRKKPIEIHAVQFTIENKNIIYNWAKSIQQNVFQSFDENKNPTLKIPTLEGEMECLIGDYLIVEPFPTDWRKLYPCKKSIFEQTYELLS